jgi:hypothetical protein
MKTAHVLLSNGGYGPPFLLGKDAAFQQNGISQQSHLSRTPPIMAFNTINGISVGADVSRTLPIYRPSVGIPLSLLICLSSLSALDGCSTIQLKK